MNQYKKSKILIIIGSLLFFYNLFNLEAQTDIWGGEFSHYYYSDLSKFLISTGVTLIILGILNIKERKE